MFGGENIFLVAVTSHPSAIAFTPPFRFYTDKDVRERSVVEITSSQAFDPTQTALPGGLYDPRLGATTGGGNAAASCRTCALPATHCPGHFGHIELAVPVYHPLLFAEIVKILKLKCFHCHKLRAPPRQLLKARAKFALLYTHRMRELEEFEDQLVVALKEGREVGGYAEEEEEEEEENEEDRVGRGRARQSQSSAAMAGAAAMDTYLHRLQPRLETWDNQQQQQQRRRNHQRSRSHGSASKSFTSHDREVRRQLITETLSACQTKVCSHCGAHIPKIRQDASNKIFQVWSKTALRENEVEGINIASAMGLDPNNTSSTRTNTRAARPQGQGGRNQSEESEDDGNNDAIMEDAAEDNDQENSDDEEMLGGNTGKSGDKYMHPGEVQAQLKRTWLAEPFLCNCLFATGACFDDTSYQIYFLQAIPVPPSRFRPPMFLNGMSVEHAQTQALSKMIQLNEQVRNHFAAKNEPQAYSAWMDLQTGVNVYMDSSKDPRASAGNNQVAPGIRQILERKEGLFRKNMMGKRVDYACRSVISPDPYVGANEIGLPRYFATVLTYPTPVTDLNFKEMRVLVERGTDFYPGARWVEIQGRRLDLSKMKDTKRQAIAAQLLTSLKRGVPAIVGRQLRDGDFVLMNRQVRL